MTVVRRWLPILFLMGACKGADAPESGSPAGITHADSDFAEWTRGEAPDLQIGVVDGDARYQLHNVVGAARLPDGSIAVMNAGSSQLRIYETDGTFRSATGRKGEGPGEFKRPVGLYLNADTILILDPDLQRMSLHALDGAHLGYRPVTWVQERFTLNDWLHDRSWIEGPLFGVGRTAVRDAIDKLPLPDSTEGFRYIIVSPFGHLWVRGTVDGSGEYTWRIYDLQGTPIARLRTPAALHIYDIGADYIVGSAMDSLDVQYIQRYRINTSGVALRRHVFNASQADTAIVEVRDSVGIERRKDLARTLRNIAGAQEYYYSNPAHDYHYGATIDTLPDFELPSHQWAGIIRASQIGWTAVAVDKVSGMICGMGVQWEAPPGWMPGVVTCDRQVPRVPR